MYRRLLIFGFCLAAAHAANWPQWRGPNSNGSTTTASGLADGWSQTDNILWRTKLPSWSAATPVIWEQTIFVTSAEEGFLHLGERRKRGGPEDGVPDKIYLLAINRKDGSIKWKHQIDSGNQLFRKQNSASPSPITDGKSVWITTGNGKLVCFSMEGREVWKRDIQADYGKFGLNHGYASTPLLDGNRLYVQVLHGMHTKDPSYVFAVEKATGKTIWKVDRPTDAQHESPDNYSTPQIVMAGGKKQIVISGGDYATGHDPDSGKELWRMGGFNPGNDPAHRTIASSLVIGGSVYTTSTRGRPFIAFKPGSGNITGKTELWTNNMGSDVPTPTSDGKYIYVLVDNGVLHCLDAETGKAVYQGQRLQLGTYSASPLLADGKLYATNEEGTTTIVKTGPVFEVIGVAKLDSHTLASPVAVDNQIFLRTDEYLYCIQKKR